MRLRIAHRITCRFQPPASGAIQMLRVAPRHHDGQQVVRWRIDASPQARLAAHEDAFGNITHVCTADGPVGETLVEIDGEVETQNTDGVVRGAVERFPPNLFLRDTPLTQPDLAIVEFAQATRAANRGNSLAELRALLQRLHQHVRCDRENPGRNAVEAFARKCGAAQDLAHILIGAARSLGIPARFVRGYFAGDGPEQHTSHAWAEAFVADVGWVGFDPASGLGATDAHVRVAVGLDHLGAAPVRGAGSETMAVTSEVGR